VSGPETNSNSGFRNENRHEAEGQGQQKNKRGGGESPEKRSIQTGRRNPLGTGPDVGGKSQGGGQWHASHRPNLFVEKKVKHGESFAAAERREVGERQNGLKQERA